MFKFNIVLMFIEIYFDRAVDTMVFYVISWNSTDLSGNIYLNTFFAGFIEVPAYVLNIFLLQVRI